MSSSRPCQCCDDLDWMAFQYVAGELSPEQQMAFELRLAHDLSACEAVARMMKTVDALAVAAQAVEPVPAESTSCPRSSRAFARPYWLAGVMAAGLLVALGLSLQVSRDSGEPVGVHPKSADRVEEIVSLWADIDLEGGDRPSFRSDVLRFEENDEDPLSVPAWMMNAVAHASERSEGEPDEQEN